jgi:adenosylcobinamide kinase/adenosylcobinamide-phosphate guanylyltransferase
MALVVITGGSRSGKSSAAQRLACESADDREVIVAVFGRDSDPEMAARARAHRASRPDSFTTLECGSATGWVQDVASDALLVIDCLGTALGALMEECWPAEKGEGLADAGNDALPEGYSARVTERFFEVIDAVCSRDGDTIVVTNEVGSGLVSLWASGRLFADLMGEANRRLQTNADAAYLAVCGRMLDLRALPAQVRWPSD